MTTSRNQASYNIRQRAAVIGKLCGVILQEGIYAKVFRADGPRLRILPGEGDCDHGLAFPVENDLYVFATLSFSAGTKIAISANVFAFSQLAQQGNNQGDDFSPIAAVQAIYDGNIGSLLPVNLEAALRIRPGQINRLSSLNVPCFRMADIPQASYH